MKHHFWGAPMYGKLQMNILLVNPFGDMDMMKWNETTEDQNDMLLVNEKTPRMISTHLENIKHQEDPKGFDISLMINSLKNIIIWMTIHWMIIRQAEKFGRSQAIPRRGAAICVALDAHLHQDLGTTRGQWWTSNRFTQQESWLWLNQCHKPPKTGNGLLV